MAAKVSLWVSSSSCCVAGEASLFFDGPQSVLAIALYSLFHQLLHFLSKHLLNTLLGPFGLFCLRYWSVLVFYHHTTNCHKCSGLKQHRFISLQFCRSEV